MNYSESFHGPLNKTESEAKLKEHGGDCFLTRYSKAKKAYQLSVINRGKKRSTAKIEEYHIIFNDEDCEFQIQGKEEVFDSIDDLLEFYQKTPISQTTASIGEPLECLTK